ncbi:DUF1847 domain-containing protein [Chloroflexota bacterium]
MTDKSQCAKCSARFCLPDIAADQKPDFSKAPSFCPTRLTRDVIENSLYEYDRDDIREFARQASLQEAQCYEHTPQGLIPRIPRIEETMQFAQKNGYQKLGLAFCLGVAREARTVGEIFEVNDFDVVSVCCKVGAVPKERIGIKPEEKIFEPDVYESMCSPITQAEVLNSQGIDLAIVMGLCVGHDSLFIKYCRAPITVLAVKDRVMGHNPLAPVYVAHSYYGRLRRPGKPKKLMSEL